MIGVFGTSRGRQDCSTRAHTQARSGCNDLHPRRRAPVDRRSFLLDRDRGRVAARVLGHDLEVSAVRGLLVLEDPLDRRGGRVADKVQSRPVVGNVVVGSLDRVAVKVRDEEPYTSRSKRLD